VAGVAGATVSATVVSTTGVGSASAGAFSTTVSAAGCSASSFLAAAAFLAAAFLTGFGSSGCSSRVRPSRTARRRIMSAYASLSDDEWLFTGTPSADARSIASAFVIPSSLASSCTRMFFAIVVLDSLF
jgi:hypothetical protein